MAKKHKFSPGDFIAKDKFIMKVLQARYVDGTYLLYPIKFNYSKIMDTNISSPFPLEASDDIGIAVYHGRYSTKPKIFGHQPTVDANWHKIDMNPYTIQVLYGKA